MPKNFVQSTVLIVLAVLLVTSVVASPVAAAPTDEQDEDDETAEDSVADSTQYRNTEVQRAYAGTNKVAATRVRKAFLQAKKAFHEARQEIQAIKKGDESPVEDVPSFFDSEDDD